MPDRSENNGQYKTETIANARLHIARRIARFCSSLSPAEFDHLLDKMVHIHWKYDVLPHLDPLVVEDHNSTIDHFVEEDR